MTRLMPLLVLALALVATTGAFAQQSPPSWQIEPGTQPEPPAPQPGNVTVVPRSTGP